MLIEVIIYNKSRDKIRLFKNKQNQFYLMRFEYDRNIHYKDFLIQELSNIFDIDVIFERILLIQFDRAESEFVVSVVVKELKSYEGSEYFSLSSLPDNKDIRESTLRAIRAEMRDITYEIPEY